jgi:hypothetical protein
MRDAFGDGSCQVTFRRRRAELTCTCTTFALLSPNIAGSIAGPTSAGSIGMWSPFGYGEPKSFELSRGNATFDGNASPRIFRRFDWLFQSWKRRER